MRTMRKIKCIKRRTLRGIVAVLSAAVTLMLGVITASAADTQAKVSAPQNIKVGESFTITVTFTSDKNIGSVKGRLDYDSSVIEFIEGEFASGAGGLCLINGWSETAGKNTTYELTFKAIDEGTAHIMLEKTSVYSDGGDLIGSPVGVASVTVKKRGEEQTQPVTTTPQPAQTEETTTSITQTVSEQTSVTTEAPSVSTTTTAGGSSANQQTEGTAPEPDGNSGSEENSADGEAAVVIGDSSASSTGNSSQTENSDMKGPITAVLLIIGCVVIVCILMSNDGKSSKKRRSSRSKRR